MSDPHFQRIGRGAVTLHGYDEKRIRKHLGRVDVRPPGQIPPIMEFADAVLIPGMDALYDRDGRRLDPTMATWLDPDIPEEVSQQAKLENTRAKLSPRSVPAPQTLQVVEEPIIFLGKVREHYGHFVVDTLARAWALGQLDPAWKVLFTTADSRAFERAAHVSWVLGRLGVGPERIISNRRPTLFRRLISPGLATQFGRRAFMNLADPHRQVAAEVMSGAPDAGFGRRVYLTRSGFSGGLREVSGEAPLEERLRREGYAVVRPETLSVADQIVLFNQATHVVGAQGSALHTALFRLPGRRLRLGALSDSAVQGRYLLVDGVAGLRSAYLNCMDEVEGAPAHIAMQVNPDRAMAMLDQAGFLAGPLRRSRAR